MGKAERIDGMCKWGTTVDVAVTIPAGMSHTGKERVAIKPIDACIADIVKALNDGGVKTVSCCCGHGAYPGHIALADGRVLMVSTEGVSGLVSQLDKEDV